MRAALALLSLLVAAFCVYGFIAAGEPGPNHIHFRIGYALMGVACVAVAVAMLLGRK